jgi:hypothetical protein
LVKSNKFSNYPLNGLYLISQASLGLFVYLLLNKKTFLYLIFHAGAQIASWLKLPFIYYATNIQIKDNATIVERVLEDSREVYEIKMPAVISVAMKSNKPRHVRL